MNPTAEAEASALIERLFPGRAFTIEPLSGGITNANFRVRFSTCDVAPSLDVVVRIPGKHTHLLGINRSAEAAANLIAARIGVAPELVGVDPMTGGVVTRYIEGRPVSIDELRTEPMLRAVVNALRQVHRAGAVDVQFHHFSIIRGYHELAARYGVIEPFDYEEAARIIALVESVRPFRPSVLGHNDLLNANFLYDGAIRILDWEYAGTADPFFDLANLSVNNALGHDRDEALLSHYLGCVDVQSLAALRLMKLVSELREAMWAVVQIAISELDVDFHAYARERSERFFALVDEIDPGRLAREISQSD